MTIPKLAPYSMDAFRASSGNNEYTRLLFIKRFITIKFKDDITSVSKKTGHTTLFENDSITDINYPELLTAHYHYIIYIHIKKAHNN